MEAETTLIQRIKSFPTSPFGKRILQKTLFYFSGFFLGITVIFFLPRLIPGNPVMMIVAQLTGQSPTGQATTGLSETIERIYRSFIKDFGLDKPLHEQYFTFLYKVFIEHDLGKSFTMYPRSTVDIIWKGLRWSLLLAIPSTLTAWVIGNYLGAYAAYKRGKTDNVLLNTLLFTSRVPTYWMAMVMLFTLAIQYHIFPHGGLFSYTRRSYELSLSLIADFLYHYTLPFLTLTLVGIGGWAIGMRSLMIYELNSDYIVYCEQLGIGEKKLISYAFRNSILPQITGLAMAIGFTVTGAMLAETVYNFPGVGYVLSAAIGGRDYPLMQALFLMIIVVIFVSNFIVDISYAFIDPRVRRAR